MHKRGLCRHAVSVCHAVSVVVSVCVSVCLSVTFVSLSKRINISSKIFHHRVPTPNGLGIFLLTRASNAGGIGRNRDSEPISGLTAYVNVATG